MNFVMHRNKTIASTCGLAVEFKRGVPMHVPPAMHKEVMAAGAIPEEEIDLDPAPAGGVEPTDPLQREAALFSIFEKMLLRNKREDFTAGGAPHAKQLAAELGWSELSANERDLAWVAFQAKED